MPKLLGSVFSPSSGLLGGPRRPPDAIEMLMLRNGMLGSAPNGETPAFQGGGIPPAAPSAISANVQPESYGGQPSVPVLLGNAGSSAAPRLLGAAAPGRPALLGGSDALPPPVANPPVVSGTVSQAEMAGLQKPGFLDYLGEGLSEIAMRLATYGLVGAQGPVDRKQAALAQFQADAPRKNATAKVFGGKDAGGIVWDGARTTYDPTTGQVRQLNDQEKMRALEAGMPELRDQRAQQEIKRLYGIQEPAGKLINMMNPETGEMVAVGEANAPNYAQNGYVLAGQASAGGQDGTTYGLNPIYGTDANGQPVLMAMGNNGTLKPVEMPAGVSVSDKAERVDLGDSWGILDRSGKLIGTLPKGTAPQTRITDDRVVTAPGQSPPRPLLGAPLETPAPLVGSQYGGAVSPVGGSSTPQSPPLLGTGTPTAAGGVQVTELPRSASDARKAMEQTEAALRSVRQIMANPARESGTGWQSMFPTAPGSAVAGFEAQVDQLGGQAFLQAFESLKGGGQITETEGKKATAAMARLALRQSDADFLEAMRELESILVRGQAKLQGVPQDQLPPIYEPRNGRERATQTLPPVAQRQVGQTYQTPRGVAIWRGSGWELVGE